MQNLILITAMLKWLVWNVWKSSSSSHKLILTMCVFVNYRCILVELKVYLWRIGEGGSIDTLILRGREGIMHLIYITFISLYMIHMSRSMDKYRWTGMTVSICRSQLRVPCLALHNEIKGAIGIKGLSENFILPGN